MQKKSLFLMIIAFLLTVIVTISITFAWFSIVEKTRKIIISSGSVKSEIKLYQVLETDEILLTDEYTFKNVIPGDNFKFKLVIKNMGTIDAKLNVLLDFFTNYEDLYDYFYLKYDEINMKIVNEITMLNDYLLLSLEEITLDFSINVSSELEIRMLGNIVKLSKITISLEQDS